VKNVSLLFDRPLLLLCILPALALVWLPFLFLSSAKRKSVATLLSFSLRTLGVSLLVLLLSGMHFVFPKNRQSLMILMDFSQSTKGIHADVLSTAQSLLDLTKDQNEVGVLAFGYNQIYTVKAGASNRITVSETPLSDATDLASAIAYAEDLMPDGNGKRIILLTDGKETDGDALSLAEQLGHLGVRIDAVYYNTATLLEKEIQLSLVKAPETAFLGEELTFGVEVDSLSAGEAVLSLMENGVSIAKKSFSLQKGKNALTLNYTPTSTGEHIYQLVIGGAEDTLFDNNFGGAVVRVSEKPSILLIASSGEDIGFFTSQITDTANLTIVSPSHVPQNLADLLLYDEVILVNGSCDELPHGFDGLLDIYIKENGGSLLTVGGNKTYVFGNMKNTAFAEFLPIDFTYNKITSQRNMAVVFVIDCSSSMNNIPEQLNLPKNGVILSLDTLGINDYAGIVSFSGSARVACKMTQTTPAGIQDLKKAVSCIQISSGTNYNQAFALAYEQLKTVDAVSKHVVFLSDGQPGDSGYEDTVSEMYAEGITVTTIGLRYDSAVLDSLAALGGGRYYYVDDAYTLPGIMQSETASVSVDPLVLGRFYPKVAQSSTLTKPLGKTPDIPYITGYVGNSVKNGATVCLSTTYGDPLYVTWGYGKGNVSSYTSDLGGAWSKEWTENIIGQWLASQMVKVNVAKEKATQPFALVLTPQGKTASLTVETHLPLLGETVSLLVTLNGATLFDAPLTKAADGIFEGEIPTEQAGVYRLTFFYRDGEQQLLSDLTAYHVVSYSPEYQLTGKDGRSLLEAIAYATGGKVVDYGNEELSLAQVLAEHFTYRLRPTVLFGVLVTVFFLLDFALRYQPSKELLRKIKKQD